MSAWLTRPWAHGAGRSASCMPSPSPTANSLAAQARQAPSRRAARHHQERLPRGMRMRPLARPSPRASPRFSKKPPPLHPPQQAQHRW